MQCHLSVHDRRDDGDLQVANNSKTDRSRGCVKGS
jgi:hypothetical protein